MRAVSKSEEHVGEWQVAIAADSLEDLFEEAAHVIARACGTVGETHTDWIDVNLTAKDDATLLVDWMNEILGLSEVHHAAFDEIRDLEVRDGKLRARVKGKHVVEWFSPLKAATYHGLKLRNEDGRWKASVLLDV